MYKTNVASFFDQILYVQLKVASATKHRNTAKEIISLLFILLNFEKTNYNILTFTLHTCPPWHADFASDLCSIHISLRGYTNKMAVT